MRIIEPWRRKGAGLGMRVNHYDFAITKQAVKAWRSGPNPNINEGGDLEVIISEIFFGEFIAL